MQPGFRLALFFACLSLLAALVNPVIGAFLAAFFLCVAWAIRRHQAWAALAGAGWMLVPVLLVVTTHHIRSWPAEIIASVALQLLAGIWFLRAAWRLRAETPSSAAWPWMLLLGLFCVEQVCFRPFVQPSSSMRPTILEGDKYFVNTIRWRTGAIPRRDDIVTFRYPLNPEIDYVKRVIGLPGDRLHFEKNSLVLNGRLTNEPYVIHTLSFPDEYRDNFPNGAASPQIRPSARDMIARYVKDGELVVPTEHYFLLGDNRDVSDDSRYWGLVPRQNIFGTPVLVYDSHQPATVPSVLNLRWNRLFRLL